LARTPSKTAYGARFPKESTRDFHSPQDMEALGTAFAVLALGFFYIYKEARYFLKNL
jgi:hypothetical protein